MEQHSGLRFVSTVLLLESSKFPVHALCSGETKRECFKPGSALGTSARLGIQPLLLIAQDRLCREEEISSSAYFSGDEITILAIPQPRKSHKDAQSCSLLTSPLPASEKAKNAQACKAHETVHSSSAAMHTLSLPLWSLTGNFFTATHEIHHNYA